MTLTPNNKESRAEQNRDQTFQLQINSMIYKINKNENEGHAWRDHTYQLGTKSYYKPFNKSIMHQHFNKN